MVHHVVPSTVVADGEVTLRLARDSDAQVISEWTRAPEVNRFWDGQAINVREALAKYTGATGTGGRLLRDLRAGRSVGYLQAWQRQGRFGLDMFISVAAQGRGIGPRAAKAIATELAALGWVPLTVDPAVDDPRAIGAWRRAGFEATGELGEDDGKTTQIMSFACSPPAAQQANR